MNKLKQCTKCKKEKSLSEYHKNKRQKSGLDSRCRVCRSEDRKKFYASSKGQKWKDYAKRPEVRAKSVNRSRQYRKDGYKSISDKRYYNSKKGRVYHLKHYYGISIEQYTEMLLAQKGVCAICGMPETTSNGIGKIRPLAVDHNHETGQVRGLLCGRCNQMLGCALDRPSMLIKGATYLKECE